MQGNINRDDFLSNRNSNSTSPLGGGDPTRVESLIVWREGEMGEDDGRDFTGFRFRWP